MMRVVRAITLLLLLLPALCAQPATPLPESAGNFTISGRVVGARPASLTFRSRAGNGYRIALNGAAAGRLEDPKRRTGPLASLPASTAGRTFRLSAEGPRLRLEWNGKPGWEYTERELSVASNGAIAITGQVNSIQFQALPDSPPSIAERYGPVLGERAPAFTAVDTAGANRDLASLAGPKGLWLLFVRSADWCVFCKTQLVEMQRQAERVRALGYNVAALTYDKPEALAHFANRRGIQFPLLSDSASAVIDKFGIRNEKATQGFAAGVPHPGLFILAPDGTVEGKYMEDDYKDRLTVAAILSGRLGERAIPSGPAVDRPRIRVTPSSSVAVVRPNQKLTLSLRAQLGRGLHAYAPGAPEEFIPVSWTLPESPAWTASAPEWPVAEKTQLYGFDEKVLNYTGVLEVSRTVTLGPLPALLPLAADGEISITGQFRYQACNDRVCFPPETVPVTWKFLVEGHDRVRVPKEMQRPGF